MIDAGGDIQVHGHNPDGEPWKIGLRNPFNRDEIVKTITTSSDGVATSGTAVRGQHIYNPKLPESPIEEIVSLTVIGPNIYEADRFATAAFAMGRSGVVFIESRPELEGYVIDREGMATLTSGFEARSNRA
jgi:thiamine biosynthesis lipoprotein